MNKTVPLLLALSLSACVARGSEPEGRPCPPLKSYTDAQICLIALEVERAAEIGLPHLLDALSDYSVLRRQCGSVPRAVNCEGVADD
jgi:hypothetical protein